MFYEGELSYRSRLWLMVGSFQRQLGFKMSSLAILLDLFITLAFKLSRVAE